MFFQWDDSNREHIALHNVSPDEAEQIFHNGPLELETQNRNGEDRFVVVGETDRGRILTLVATWRGHELRVLTSWDATKSTKTDYLRNKASNA